MKARISAAFLVLALAAGAQTLPRIRGRLLDGQNSFCVDVRPNQSVAVLVNSIPVSLIRASDQARVGSVEAAGDANVCVQLEVPLAAGQAVRIVAGESQSDPMVVQSPFDWGRVRGYFTAGLLLSKERDDFASQDVFLSFGLDSNWLLLNRSGLRRLRLNTFFEARLTSVPVEELRQSTPAALLSSLETTLVSRKAATLDGGLYLPVTLAEWDFHNGLNSLFVAPLARIGFETPTGAGAQSPPAVSADAARFFTSHAFGARLGHYREFGPTRAALREAYQSGGAQAVAELRRDASADQAPELVNHIDLLVGKYGNFERFQPLLDLGTVRVRDWRYALEGVLKVPDTPFILGFSANVAASRSRRKNPLSGIPDLTQPHDDLRFLFGMRFDAARLFRMLKMN